MAMLSEKLAASWQQLTAPFTPDEALRRAALQQLAAAYEAPGRHYHTLTHIQALLEAVHEAPTPLHDAEVVQLAVWFHDAVYSPLRSDNEERSAVLAREFLTQTTLAPDRISRVVLLIERTKDHTQPQPDDPDLHFFLDADLQILGAPPAEYEQYAHQIRQEYRLVPGPLYRRGRRAVLQNMLAAATLYCTEYFQNKLDARARQNLQRELDDL
jgi:predicted metal-dependent HD superfamily phosphohydrolase